jgi:hypothetical protein
MLALACNSMIAGLLVFCPPPPPLKPKSFGTSEIVPSWCYSQNSESVCFTDLEIMKTDDCQRGEWRKKHGILIAPAVTYGGSFVYE